MSEPLYIELPRDLDVELECPRCGAIASTTAKVATRLVADQDGSGTLGVRVKAAKVPHLCAQLSLTLDAPARSEDQDAEP